MIGIEELRRLEMTLHDPAVRSDPDRVSALLAPDFVEFGASGTIYDRDRMIALLGAEGGQSYGIESDCYALKLIGADAALLTYRSFRTPDDGRYVLRSSLWQRIGGRWQMRFHQGTPVGS